MIRQAMWVLGLVLTGGALLAPWWFAGQGLPMALPLTGTGFWDYPGIATVVGKTLLVGLLSSLLALACASLIMARDAVALNPARNDVGITFAAPHLAFAIAFLWLFTPYGWFDRLLPFSLPWFEQQSLVTLITILVIKETPFLVVMGRQQLGQLPYRQWLLQGQALGTAPDRSWWLVVFPAWLRAMRLILFAVAIYSVAVVDLAQVAGPLNPPLLAPLIVSWQLQFDAVSQSLAAQGTWLLIAFGVVMVVAFYLLERSLTKLIGWRIGSRVKPAVTRIAAAATHWFSFTARGIFVVVSCMALVALVALSLGRGWFYPQVLPQVWNFEHWLERSGDALTLATTTLGLALATATLATLMIVWLREWQRYRSYELADAWLLLALFVPQLSLVVAWLASDWSTFMSSTYISVLVAHVWFSFAYGYLVYAPAERAVTQIHLSVGRSLGYRYWHSWWWFKRPLLHSALAHCFMVTFLVSVAQYVPTLLLSAGRLPTLTTELVAVSSGGEWQLPALYATLLWLIAFSALMLTQITRKKRVLR
ncbi:hypothetical protein CWI69_03785 [Pseudidiomarina halophila]|uniref:ABC transmembrane type-1 domain-containing protein n=2 Tax=Pseudidiomarina halophila TaxID=1449799 RepID=A0A432Y0Q9_9GAMM|nr:hypothetical protein CWI69_03785 [Pseudidiomarina halophila]